MKKLRGAIVLFFLFSFQGIHAAGIIFDFGGLQNSKLLSYTTSDAIALFKKSNCTVTTQQESSTSVKIELRLEKDTAVYQTLYESNTKENQGFAIHAFRQEGLYVISIRSLSEKGLSNGIYYWMQHYLGFQFYHSKETIIPDLSTFPTDTFTIHVAPRFDKIGFHIHSQHPLELTDALLDEKTPNGQKEIETYLNWLCRNGQNYFEFCLLRSVKLPEWLPYIKPVVDYAHDRGIICGIDMSFHMIQQRAFQLYKNFPSSFKSKDKQITANIAQLMQVNWDEWSVEFSTTEFSQKNQEKLYLQQKFLYDSLQKYHVKLATRKHVVKDENLLSNAKSFKKKDTDMDSAYAIFVHTVMFYSLDDSSTPVYRNKDFSHIKTLLQQSNKFRDTWYYPESAYWITFDSSIPMFLLPYLDARLKDIQYCDTLGIDGHITFSSGWEWNYWLIDWSIAQWCWKADLQALEDPLQYLKAAVKDSSFTNFVSEASGLQEKFIKNKQLIKVMDAQTITDEIGGKLNLELEPRPEYPFKYIMNKATQQELDFFREKYINGLDSFVEQYNAIRAKYHFNDLNKVEKEMLNSLDVVALRAEHRKNTLLYLVHYRSNKIGHTKNPIFQYLDSAAAIRTNALAIVKEQETGYRYPVSNLASQRLNKTVYNFGFLYTASNLHFWEREELQAKNNKWKFWYQNIWDVLKIIGVKK